MFKKEQPPLEEEDETEQLYASGIGPLLKASRQRCGEELIDVARMLRIRYPYLEAIEDGRFDDLPGPTYAIGFIRAYAEHLGLDSDEVIRRYKNEGAGANGKSELFFPEPLPESEIPGGAVLFIAVLLAVVAYGGWYVSSSKDGFFAELVAPVPDRLATLAAKEERESTEGPAKETIDETAPETVRGTEGLVRPETEHPETWLRYIQGHEAKTGHEESDVTDAEEAVSPPDEMEPPEETAENTPVKTPAEESEAATEPPAEETSAPESEPVAETPAEEPAAESAPESTEEEPVRAFAPEQEHEPEHAPEEAALSSEPASQPEETTARTFGAGEGESRIMVRAKKSSWIQVRDDISKQLLVTRLLRAGDIYRVPDRPGLMLLTGNAGALEILIDGEAVPSIGEQGTVRRSVELDVKKLRQGTAIVE